MPLPPNFDADASIEAIEKHLRFLVNLQIEETFPDGAAEALDSIDKHWEMLKTYMSLFDGDGDDADDEEGDA